MTGTERARRAQERRVESGGRVVRVILSPAAAAALSRLTAASGQTMTQAIEQALQQADAARVGTGD